MVTEAKLRHHLRAGQLNELRCRNRQIPNPSFSKEAAEQQAGLFPCGLSGWTLSLCVAAVGNEMVSN